MDVFVVALAPLLALIVVLLFHFIGCSIDTSALPTRLTVTVRFFPPAEPPPAEPRVFITPIDSPYTTGDIGRPSARPATDRFDGSREQSFAYGDIPTDSDFSVGCRVQQDSSTIIDAMSVTVPATGDNCVRIYFGAPAGAREFAPASVTWERC